MATLDASATSAASATPFVDDEPGFLRRFAQDRAAVMGLTVVVILAVLSMIGSETRALAQDLPNANRPPSSANWLGTDALGRDVLSRALVGGRVSLLVAIASVAAATILGATVGAIAGYYRRTDFFLMRIVDVMMSFPAMILMLIAVSLIGPGTLNVILLIAIVSWTVPCRITRAEFLRLRDAEFVLACRGIGLRDRSIVIRHILPNASTPLLVFVTLGVVSVVILEAGLSYLGLGVQPPTPSWGNMLDSARSLRVLLDQPWQWVPPAILVITFALGVNLVGDGLRRTLDPRAADR